MKKKNFIILSVLAALIIVILFTVYYLKNKNSKSPEESDTNQSVSTESDTNERDAAESEPTEQTTNPTYSITTETYSWENIEIQYPRITGLADESKENAINELIENDILGSQDIANPELTLNLEYEVKMNTDELLSVIYTGYANIKGAAYPTNKIYSVTIDLKNASELELSDFTAIDSELIQKIRQSTEVTNTAVNGGIDKNQLIGYIRDNVQDDEMLQGLREGWDYYNAFYVTPDSLGVSVGVIHALGDYALVEIPGQYTPK